MYKSILALTVAAIIAMGVFAFGGAEDKNKPSTSAQSGAFTGYVTDAKCKRNIDAACNKACFQDGEAPVLLLDSSGDLLRLNNAEEVKKYPGAHVEIKGVRENDVLTVSSVTKR